MSQSIKLSNNTYIDTTGVWDNTVKNTQNAINGAISNRNLLDNGWFTVNQRGESSWEITPSTFRYIIDRWKGAGEGTITLSNNIITLGQGTEIHQIIDQDDDYVGKTVTATVMYSNGMSDIITFQYSHSGDTLLNNERIELYRTFSNSHEIIRVYANSQVSIKAIKLELGSISTLANDTAPNYTEELLKCQRYFCRVGMIGTCGYSTAVANLSVVGIKIPVVMRTTPNISYTPVSGDWSGNNVLGTTTNIAVLKMINNTVYVNVTTTVNFTDYTSVTYSDAGDYTNADLSADL